MISKEEILKIRSLLEDSSKPLFLFDNDPDGFCSSIILMKNIGRGQAMPIKNFPKGDLNMINKILKILPDKIFVLDKPLLEIEFLKKMKEINIEVIYIDHHEADYGNLKNVFNSFPSSEPTSYLCQQVFNNENTLWISLLGCIHDVYSPKYIEKVVIDYPELIRHKSPNEIKYLDDFGKVVRMLSLSLKSYNSFIEDIISLFLKAKNPYDILNENDENRKLHQRYNSLNKFINRQLEKAVVINKLVYLEYSGEYSLSSDISNILYFNNPEKFIVVCYKKEDFVNISLRGECAKKITQKITSELEFSTGGGHDLACGLRIPLEKFREFKKIISENIEKIK
jgi:single-stranded DNA-specific DHH superfamily exonuclease